LEADTIRVSAHAFAGALDLGGGQVEADDMYIRALICDVLREQSAARPYVQDVGPRRQVCEKALVDDGS